MITCSNSLTWRERRGVQSVNRPETAATGQFGLPRMRTALHDLRVVLSGAQHPIQTNRQFVGDSHFGHAVMLVHRQTYVLPVPTRILALCLDCSFHEQPAQQRIALLGDASHPLLMLAAGRLGRNQPQITAHLLAAGESPPVPQDQYVGPVVSLAYV